MQKKYMTRIGLMFLVISFFFVLTACAGGDDTPSAPPGKNLPASGMGDWGSLVWGKDCWNSKCSTR